MNVVYIAIACGLLAVLYGIVTILQVLKAPAGNERMQDIAAAVQEGARAYLARQYRTIAIVGVIVVALVAWFLGPISAVGFAIGAILSGVTGFVGMNVSVKANVRTAEAARTSLQGGLTMAFRSGAITGLLVAGLGLLAISGFFWYLIGPGGHAPNDRTVVDALVALVRAVHSQDAGRPDAGRAVSGTVLLEQVKAHIEARLGDPGLGPDALARAHYVSTRYLQKQFAADGLTVSGWIRMRRLEACRRDLCDPALAREPISQVARRWALANPAHFSRLFRETYGCTPSELRARAREG